MAGLNNIREAYQQVYSQIDERMDPEERALRRAEIADKKASRMDAKVAAKYAGSEAKSAEREDKKSRGKHIHGMADSVELDGELVDEAQVQPPMQRLKTDRNMFSIPEKEREAARERIRQKTAKIKAERKSQKEEFVAEEDPCWKGYTQVGMKKKNGREVPNCVPSKGVPKATGYKKEDYQVGDPSYKAASHVGEETLLERPLDTAETGEKERLVKGMKKSASDFKKKYGKRWKNVMYATATKKAKEHMDTSKSDRRYAVEETSMDESADLENRKKGPRKPSQIQKREKLTRLIDQIRSKKEGESK